MLPVLVHDGIMVPLETEMYVDLSIVSREHYPEILEDKWRLLDTAISEQEEL